MKSKIWKKLNESGVGANLNPNSGRYRLGDVETREFVVECKYNRYPRVFDYLNFLEKCGEKTNKIPVVVAHHMFSQKDYAILRLEDFIKLMKVYEAWRYFKAILQELIKGESKIAKET
ncbi:MAG: hypothetical protein ACTSYM_04040 [Candidatus Baldrarchaeia archaeon]